MMWLLFCFSWPRLNCAEPTENSARNMHMNRREGAARREGAVRNVVPRQAAAAAGRQGVNVAEPEAGRVASGEYVAMLRSMNRQPSSQNNPTSSGSADRPLAAASDPADPTEDERVTKICCSSDL